jgi:hypothetical protein
MGLDLLANVRVQSGEVESVIVCRWMEKELILDEIRPCATANGGRPLGRKRFTAETGITESMWSGRFWTRWNDALSEAGFRPNRMNEPYDEGHLLRHLALLVRDLGRFPAESEIRMRRQKDATFPSSNTFAQFGNKEARIARLADFCASESDLHDVAAILAPLVAREGAPVESEDATERRQTDMSTC